MLVLMFGQLIGCGSLRELTDITIAHGRKSFFLGFGKKPMNRQILSKANSIRDHRIFEEFASYMMGIAQKLRITKDFELYRILSSALLLKEDASYVQWPPVLSFCSFC